MPPHETRLQARQRSLLEYGTSQISEFKTHHSAANSTKKRFKQDSIFVENQPDDYMDSKDKLCNFNPIKLKGEPSLKGNGIETDQKLSTLTISSEEDETPVQKKKRVAQQRTKVAMSDTDTDIEVLPSGESKNHGNLSGTSSAKQLNLLKYYATPRKSGDLKEFAAVKSKSQVYESDSESDSPRKIRFEPRVRLVSNESTLSSQVNLDSKGASKRDNKTTTTQGRKRLIQKSSSEEDNFPAVRKRKDAMTLISSGDEDLGMSPSKRRKLFRGSRPRLRKLSSEDEELLEEAVNEESTPRLKIRSKRADFVKNLEKLKKRKRGESFQNYTMEEDDQEDHNSGSDAGATRFEDTVFTGSKPSHLYNSDEDSLNQDDEDQNDDFIVDDGESGIELPAMFNMGTFQDLSHHFKVVCQLFVHLSIKKRGRRTQFMKQALDNTYFSVPLHMARRKLLGLRDSLVASSVWKPGFRKPLEKFPEFKLQHLDFAIPHCDACNLGSRLSTFSGLLRGQKYDHTTYQSRGKEISIDWNLGRFCAARAHIFHRLTHWEHTLFHTLDTEINSLRAKIQGHSLKSRRNIFIPATRGPPPPDDPDDADGWMEWLDGRGIIEAEWQGIKMLMNKAHGLQAMGNNDNNDVDYS